uniref:Uncharacterized protein n=1 Tax=Rhizophora mucronata TaxID=61149 RepID=A0A2P2QQC1_RHIMU
MLHNRHLKLTLQGQKKNLTNKYNKSWVSSIVTFSLGNASLLLLVSWCPVANKFKI